MNNVITLRKHLFETLEAVKKGKMSPDHAKVISDISQTIINSAKLEVDFCKATGETLSESFLPVQDYKQQLPGSYAGVRVHKIKG